MKKIIVGSLVVMFVSIFSVTAASAALPENFGGNGDAWVNDFGQHYVNSKNPHVRKDWTNHLFAVPGQGGWNSNENSAILAHPNGIDNLVDPHGICEVTTICR